MFHFLISIIHTIVAILLILIILVQANKGMGLAGAFGAVGAGENFLSTSGAFNILVKITTAMAIIFCVTSICLSYIPPASNMQSIMADDEIAEPQTLKAIIEQQNQEQSAQQSAPQSSPQTAP